MSTTRPSKPSSRRVSAALAPARLAPTITNVCILGSPSFRQGEKFLPRARVLAHEAVECRGDRPRAWLLDAAQRHAQVLGLDNHADALGLQVVLQPVGHLA